MSLPVSSKVGRSWNSIWTTSGAPEPALSAVRNLVYSGAPWPALTTWTVMPGCAFWNRLTSVWMFGTHVQNVRVTGAFAGAAALPDAPSGVIMHVTRARAAMQAFPMLLWNQDRMDIRCLLESVISA